MKHCKDCEPAQESHIVAYLSVVLGWFDEPVLGMMEKIFQNTADKIAEKFSIPFFNLMAGLRLGYFTHKPAFKDSLRTKCFWEEAERRGIKMKEFHLDPISNAFVAEYETKNDIRRISFDGLPRPGLSESKSLKWMDNKGIMKKKFQKEGIPVAPGGTAMTKWRALSIFNRINKPVITKPNLGSRSRHTMIHLNTPSDLMVGFKKAKKLSPIVVIEEELRGYLYRGTLIGGKLVGVVRRDQPEVKGDGINTLRELLSKENERPERTGPIFHKIPIDKEMEVELGRQGVDMESIIEKDRVITFSQKTSRGCGGTTTELTGVVHRDNREMLEHVAKFLDDPLIGVDFVMEDVARSWKEEQHCGVIECNSLPFIDLHHYVMFGQPVNVAGALWDLVMPESKSKQKI